jgi:hypothetical protein
MPSQEIEAPQTEKSEEGIGKELEIPSEIPENISKNVRGTTSLELGSPITSLNTLQSTYRNPQEGALYVSDLEPISRDEIPSSDYFFCKKRKVILKQEMNPRGDMMIKKHKIIIDGKKLKEGEFTTEIASTMGSLASVNLYSMGSLTTMLEEKDQRIAQPRGQLKETERNISWEIEKGLERVRLNDIQEIQKMKASLEEENHKI